MGRRLSPRATAILLLVLGCIALAVGIMELRKQHRFSVTDAVITRIDEDVDFTSDDLRTDYTVYVHYTVGGKDYDEVLGYFENGYEEGKTIQIRYNPENPTDVTGNGKGFSIYLTVIGPLLMVCAAVVFFKEGR